MWAPPTGVLGELAKLAESRNASLRISDVTHSDRPRVPSLFQALRGDSVRIIAEVKRKSPSKGTINAGLDAVQQAKAYESGGAAAISVLTEPQRFGGSDEDLSAVGAETTLPLVKKDFHVGERQLIQARMLGASAALLIVRAVPPAQLATLAAVARDVELEILYEVRDERELETALRVGARIVGVNNRNLETLQIDPGTVERIVPLIPPDCIAVAESGYTSLQEVTRASDAGADAVLIGSHLSAATDPAAAVRELSSVRRQFRAG